MTIAVIDGGTRLGGNTELLTEEAVKGVNVDRIRLNEYTIRPIIDGRHAEEGFPEMNDDHKEVIDRVLAADDRFVRIVVEIDQLFAPADPYRLARRQHDANCGLQAPGPGRAWPERRLRPIEPINQDGKLVAWVERID